MDEEVLGGMGYLECFLFCVESLREEELIKRSPRGQRVEVLLNFLKSIENKSLTDIAISILSNVNNCLIIGSTHVLPSAARGAVWSAFHQLRANDKLKQSWNAFIFTQVPQDCQQEHPLALQLLLDRVLKRMLANKAKVMEQKSDATSEARPLTTLESNAIRYMSGYVGVSLLKKYRRSSKNPQLKLKWDLFVRVLKGMCATDQPGEPDSILDYSKVWSETIDRGGLYHINDKVLHSVDYI